MSPAGTPRGRSPFRGDHPGPAAVLDHLRIGAWIVRRQRHLRRHDVGELDRDRPDGNQVGQRNNDGNHGRKSRPVDEYAGKQRLQLLGATFADTTWPAWTF